MSADGQKSNMGDPSEGGDDINVDDGRDGTGDQNTAFEKEASDMDQMNGNIDFDEMKSDVGDDDRQEDNGDREMNRANERDVNINVDEIKK